MPTLQATRLPTYPLPSLLYFPHHPSISTFHQKEFIGYCTPAPNHTPLLIPFVISHFLPPFPPSRQAPISIAIGPRYLPQRCRLRTVPILGREQKKGETGRLTNIPYTAMHGIFPVSSPQSLLVFFPLRWCCRISPMSGPGSSAHE